MPAEEVTHAVIAVQIESLKGLMLDNQRALESVKYEVGNIGAVTTLAADAIPRHEKSIDSLWSFIRDHEKSVVNRDDHMRIVELLDRVTERLDRLERNSDLNEGHALGSKAAHDDLKEKATYLAKGLGILVAGGGAAGISVKMLAILISWIM